MEVVEKLFRLEAEEELRVEVDCGKTDKVTVELKSGHAEIFGTELVINTRFTLLQHSHCPVINNADLSGTSSPRARSSPSSRTRAARCW